MEREKWDSYFIKIATEVSIRSPDPKKKVGSVIVDNNNRIISTGYNGLPNKIDENIDWNDRKLIKSIIIHSECNALLYCKYNLQNCKLYITLSPCCECLKLIRASNITTVYYKEKYKHYDNVKKIADILGVDLIHINMDLSP